MNPRVHAWPFLFAVALFAPSAFAGNFYAGTSPTNVPWPGGIVPYEFTNTLSAAQRETYVDGLREWELAANVKFVPHTNQTRWILFDYNTNFLDFVAGGYGPQLVSVSSLGRAQVCHEMGHSFGFTHENIRTDQTNHLTVLTNNISDEPTNIFWFTIDPASITNGTYDFESVMHLGWDFVSTQRGVLATQQPKPPYFPRYQFRMGNYCLSPGDRAALQYLYGPPAVALTNIVTTTADVGPGSLRAALYYVTDHPGAVVRFAIPTNDPGFSNGVFTIHLTGHLPPLAANGMVIDGSTQPGFAGKPVIVVDGSQILPETFTSNSGLLIYSANNQVKNISFQGFNWNGLTLEYVDATNNTVAGCWLGLDATGSNAAPNAYQGIFFDRGPSHNTIGGTNPLARNVISGNSQYGLWMSDTNTTGNVILGNYIGTDAGGSVAVPNQSGGIGIFTNGIGHIIGGTNAGAGNVISGNGSAGIWLSGASISNVTVLGNYVGLNAAGTAAVSNTFAGMYVLDGATGNFISGNVFSGQPSEGIRIAGAGTSGNVVAGNFFGTDASGANSVPNGYAGLSILAGATSNTIGGTVPSARNIFSGNAGNYSYGLVVGDAGTSGNVVQGNYFGLAANGFTAVPNYYGLGIVNGAASNIIGGTVAGARNLISGNANYGLVVRDSGTSGNVIEGNYIGLAPDGSTAVPNYHGVAIFAGATSNLIGGISAAGRNIVSGNNGSGFLLSDPGTFGNFIQGNYIGTDASGTQAVANANEGLYLLFGASGNFIGGAAPGAGNVISGNNLRGIYAYGTSVNGNWIAGNIIGAQPGGSNPLGNGWDGIVFFDGASSNVVGLAASGVGAANQIAFNGFTGVYVGSDNTNESVGNTIRGNSIYGNARVGINLAGGTEDSFGVTANHMGGPVMGPNDLQNYPVLTSASASVISTIISGTLNGAPNRNYLVDVYWNTSADPSGHGQGQVYAGSAGLTTDGTGNGGFSLSISANLDGKYFTATATATATDTTTGDTSEFAADVIATNGPAPLQFIGPYARGTNGFTFGLLLQSNLSYRIQAATNLATNPVAWLVLTNFTANTSPIQYTDRSATNFAHRFYRVVSP